MLVELTPKLLYFTKLCCLLQFLPQPSNVFTQISLSQQHFTMLFERVIISIKNNCQETTRRNRKKCRSSKLQKRVTAASFCLTFKLFCYIIFDQENCSTWTRISLALTASCKGSTSLMRKSKMRKLLMITLDFIFS